MHKPIWTPLHPDQTYMAAFMRYVNQHDYHDLHAWSIQHFPDFWEACAHFFKIPFYHPPTQIFQKIGHKPWENSWFKEATFNIADCMLRGNPHQIALIATNENQYRRTFTYAELKAQVAACAHRLKKIGVQSEDRVAAIMPNTAETIIAMLATASIGAIWSSCSPDFGETALLDRLTQIEPCVLFVCDIQQYQGKTFHILKKVEPLLKQLPYLKQLIVCPASTEIPVLSSPNMILWEAWIAEPAAFTPLPLPFSHPLYILFSSGTTGRPKCIVHATGHVYIQHLKELGLHTNINATDTLFFYTTCGWMMWNWMVSALSLGATLLLYDGSPAYPHIGGLFALLATEKVTVFGTGSRFLALVEKAALHPYTTYDLSHLCRVLSTASPLLPSQYDYFYQYIHPTAQLCSISGGTDIVSCFALGNPILPIYKGEIQCIGLGMDVQIFNASGQPIRGQKGELVCCTPFPTMPLSFWKNDNNAYEKAYFSRFPHVWTHGDFAEITAHQGLIIHGRSDTTLNPGGVRIGTAEIYRILELFPEIEESVVVGKQTAEDVKVYLFVKLKTPFRLNKILQEKIKQCLKTQASGRHVPDVIKQVPDIPKTINGKVVEMAIKQILEGETIQNIASIANPEALTYFHA